MWVLAGCLILLSFFRVSLVHSVIGVEIGL